VFIFFRRLDLAIAAGIFESISKIVLFFFHERIWNRIKFGKKRIDPFVIWFTGVPLAGKSSIARKLAAKLADTEIPHEMIDSSDIRTLVPQTGYSRTDRIEHLKRVEHLVNILQKNSISVIASFITPYQEIRDSLRTNTRNYIEIYVKASDETLRKRDINGIYAKAEKGEIKNFTGVSDVYEEPQNPDIVLDTENTDADKAAEIIMKYLQKRIIKDQRRF
jgi:adenylylsulfate kinase